MRLRGGLFGLMLLLVCASGWAGVRDTVALLSVYNEQCGLPHAQITCIHRDRRAVMWFGTRGGVVHFDGESMTSFRHAANDPRSLGSDEVRALDSDRSGDIWVGTSAGFSRYSGARMAFRNYAVEGGVWGIRVDGHGRVWGILEGGLGLLDTVSGALQRFDYPSRRAYRNAGIGDGIWDDGRDRLWLLRGGELLIFSISAMDYVSEEELYVILAGVSPSAVTGFSIAGDGSLWLGRGLSIFHFVSFNHAPREYRIPFDARAASRWYGMDTASLRIGGVYPDARGRVWCRVGGGFYCLDPRGEMWLHVGSFWDHGTRVELGAYEAYDFTGGRNFWVGLRGGVGRWHQVSELLTPYCHRVDGAQIFNSLDIRSVYTADDRWLYVGTCGGGVSLYDRESGMLSELPRRTVGGELRLDTIHSLLRGWGRGLYAVVPRGVAVYDSLVGAWRAPGAQQALMSALEGRWGGFRCGVSLEGTSRMLVGGDAGLWLLDMASGEARPVEGLEDVRVRGLCVAREGVFVAGNGFLYRYDADSEDSHRYDGSVMDHKASAKDELLVQCLAAGEDAVYVGTNRGIYCYVRGVFSSLGERRGEIPQDVQCVVSLGVDGNGTVWSASSEWLGEYSWGDEDFYTYGHADGVYVGEFNQSASFVSPGGKLYFGARGGMVVVSPDKEWNARGMPPVVLSRCVAARGTERVVLPHMRRDTIELPGGYNALILGFALLDYTAPGIARYQYLVEGMSADWCDADDGHRVFVSNLPYGTSRIRFRGSNREGIWLDGGEYVLLVSRSVGELWRLLSVLFGVLLCVSGVVVVCVCRGRRARGAQCPFGLLRGMGRPPRAEGEHLSEAELEGASVAPDGLAESTGMAPDSAGAQLLEQRDLDA